MTGNIQQAVVMLTKRIKQFYLRDGEAGVEELRGEWAGRSLSLTGKDVYTANFVWRICEEAARGGFK